MARQLKVEIVGDASSLQRAFGAVGKQSRTFGENVRRGATIAGTALTAGLAVSAKIGFDELAEGQKVAAQTSAVLKSTGQAANVTARDVDKLATSLSRKSAVDDEAIASGENLLLTFTNIRNEAGKNNDIFNQTTKATLDMSVAMGTDMTTAALQVGKAMNDPVKGMTRLQRVGVTFTKSQVDMVKGMVAAGDTMGAQKVILAELNKEFGGSAEAFGETMPGQIQKAKLAFEEMAAGLVQVLLPAILAVTGVFSKFAGFLQEHQTTAKALGGALVGLAAILLTVGAATKLYAAGQALVTAATSAWTAVQWALNAALTANPIGVVVVALAALVAGLILAYKNSETFRRIVDAAFKAVKAAAQAVLDFFRNNWKVIATLISGPFAPIVALATDAFGIRSKLVAAGNAILDFFRGNWKTIATLISGPFAPLVALATNAFGIRSTLVNAFQAIVNGIREKVAAAVEVVRGIPGRFLAALGNLSSLLYNAGVQIIQGLINGITAKLGELWGLVGSIGGKIKGLKGPIEEDRRLLRPEGEAIIGGLIDGINNALPELNRTVSSIGPSLDIGDGGQGAAGEGMARNLERQNQQWLSIRTTQQQQQLAQEQVWQKQIVDMVASYAPDYRAAAKQLGDNLAAGLNDAAGGVIDAANKLAASIAKALGVAAEFGKAAVVNVEGKLAGGGPVRAGSPYIVGERGPELFIPNLSGTIVPNGATSGAAGGGSVVFNFPNYVGTREELIREVRAGLAEVGRDNPTIFAGRA